MRGVDGDVWYLIEFILLLSLLEPVNFALGDLEDGADETASSHGSAVVRSLKSDGCTHLFHDIVHPFLNPDI